MLAYYYPPLITSGVNRTLGFTRYLKEFAWDATILTVKNSKDPWCNTGAPVPLEHRVVRTPETNLSFVVRFFSGALRRLFRLLGKTPRKDYFREWICIPDAQITWHCTFKGLRLASEHDCIYVTCSPFSTAVKGAIIQRLSGKPLIVDFRDPWAATTHAGWGGFHKNIALILERFVVNTCQHLILNTQGSLKIYSDRYPEQAYKMQVIPNGFDGIEPVQKTQRKPSKKFVIMHVGNFYLGRQPDLLLESLAELADNTIEFVQVGDPFPSYERFREKVQIKIIPTVPPARALELMRNADILYLKQPRFEPHNIYVAAKTYEYIATGLPILAECSEGDNTEVLRQFASECFIVSGTEKSVLKQTLLRAREHIGKQTSVARVKPEFVERYHRRMLTKSLVGIFEEAIEVERECRNDSSGIEMQQ